MLLHKVQARYSGVAPRGSANTAARGGKSQKTKEHVVNLAQPRMVAAPRSKHRHGARHQNEDCHVFHPDRVDTLGLEPGIWEATMGRGVLARERERTEARRDHGPSCIPA